MSTKSSKSRYVTRDKSSSISRRYKREVERIEKKKTKVQSLNK